MNRPSFEISEVEITRTVNGMPMQISAVDVGINVDYSIEGEDIPARIYGPPEDCYPAEYAEVCIGSVTLFADTAFYDHDGEYVMTLPKGTDILGEFTQAHLDYLEEEIYEACLKDRDDAYADYLYDQRRDLLAERAA